MNCEPKSRTRANCKSGNMLNMLPKHMSNAGDILLRAAGADLLLLLCHFNDKSDPKETTVISLMNEISGEHRLIHY